jgi:hypothetical protein
MQLLTSLENSAIPTWVRESSTIWAYPTVLTLHTLGMGVLVGASWTLDLRLLGIGPRIPLRPMRVLFPVMWAGFWVNAVTGSVLFAASATAKGTSILFLTKLILIALGVTTIFLLRQAIDGGRDDLEAVHGTTKLLAIASMFLWLAAITAGRLLAYLT